MRTGLFQFDLDTITAKVTPLEFQGHSTLSPAKTQPHIMAVLPKYGKEMAFVDTSDQKVVDSFKSHLGYFYGHGVVDEQRNCLYTTEGTYAHPRTDVVIRDLKTFKPLGILPGLGARSHDLALSPDGRFLYIANGDFSKRDEQLIKYHRGLKNQKRQASLIIYDLKSSKLETEIPFANVDKNIGHLALAPTLDVILAGSEFGHSKDLASVMFYNRQSNRILISTNKTKGAGDPIAPKKFLSGTNSVSLDTQKNLASVTHQDGFVSLWNYKEHRFVAAFQTKTAATGTSLDRSRSQFYITTSGDKAHKVSGNIFALDPKKSSLRTVAPDWEKWGLSKQLKIYFSTHNIIV